jgi:hypothetical protein
MKQMSRSGIAATIDVEFALNRPVRSCAAPAPTLQASAGHTPHLTRLMALAIKCRDMVESGEVRDYAELARAGYITRARMSQIMNLVNLAPDIQEEILFLPKVSADRFPLSETRLRKIACQPLWERQRTAWRKLRQECMC